jgi:hypothetical protein
MAGEKLVVMHPRSKDVAVFEKIYQDQHVPLTVAKLCGKTKIVAARTTAGYRERCLISGWT